MTTWLVIALGVSPLWIGLALGWLQYRRDYHVPRRYRIRKKG